ncbi:MAG: T9SS type A sorting domain-containing protein [Bacteroidales bacterium]|nr:T9SS type A sorting domain-containing protein [Bacteroidales bacterium]
MKKILTPLLCLTISLVTFAQTIVSTEVQKRKVVFEEFTGVDCQYCPNGHAILSEFAQQNPGTVIINIHQGPYARMYATQWGNTLASQSNLEGWPAFTVGRTVNNCVVTNYFDPNLDYSVPANNIKSQDSPINIAATATVDASTRTMTVHFEAYYTADVSQNFNMLQIALLQDNIVGPQANAANYNPSQILPNGQYNHMHMLRDLVTGKAWGDTIALNEEGVIEAGTFISKDYTYEIPEVISNENVLFGDINLAIFVSDGQNADCPSLKATNILTGIKVEPEYINIEGNNAVIQNLTLTEQYGCSTNASVKLAVRNNGAPITSMTITYRNTTTETTDHTYTFTGTIDNFTTEEIELEDLPIIVGATNEVVVNIISVNGESFDNISKTATIKKTTPKEGIGVPTVILKTDKYGNEFTWQVVDDNNNVLASGGPYATNRESRDTVLVSALTQPGCYTLVAMDEYGDGLMASQPNGFIRILDQTGYRMANLTGSYKVKKADFVITSMEVGLNDANGVIAQSILYPNPAVDMTTLKINTTSSVDANIQVVDVLGRVAIQLDKQRLYSGENKIDINTSNLNDGTYFVRIITNDGMTSNRLNISK